MTAVILILSAGLAVALVAFVRSATSRRGQ